MTSIVNAAVTAVVAALSAATPVAAQIDRTRLRPLKANSTTAVVVRATQSDVEHTALGFNNPSAWATTLLVECYAKAAAGTTPDVAVDALAKAVYARLMTDPTLAGAVRSLSPNALSYDFDTDAEQTVCATFTFIARHVAGASVFS